MRKHASLGDPLRVQRPKTPPDMNMSAAPNYWLTAGAILSAIAAAMHLACIAFGASWYRAMGAGEQMATMADAGSSYPAKITVMIALILLVWSLYALSGAGIIGKLPLLRTGLCAITAVYLLRGFAFYPLIAFAPGRSASFWLWSSVTCAVFGIVHAIGLARAWPRL